MILKDKDMSIFGFYILLFIASQASLALKEIISDKSFNAFLLNWDNNIISDQNTSRILSSKSRTGNPCVIENNYIPSTIEKYWMSHIESISILTLQKSDLKDWTTGCSVSKLFLSDISNVWLHYWNQRERMAKFPSENKNMINPGNFKSLVLKKDLNLFSEFQIKYSCANSNKSSVYKIPIEPLFGALRHPLLCGPDGRIDLKYVLDKDYMLPLFKHEIIPPLTPGFSKSILFDLGASLYTSGFGGASQSWFVDTYSNRGIIFDRILAWEAILHDPKVIFNEFPEYALGVISYFNIPATTDRKSIQNPLNMLKHLCKESDFVVFKIDIDHNAVEMEFIHQILENDGISSLIDELYFEHHVSASPMMAHGWAAEGTFENNSRFYNITESYQLFTDLRNKGIRAHSWV